jgi:hypothetical protein
MHAPLPDCHLIIAFPGVVICMHLVTQYSSFLLKGQLVVLCFSERIIIEGRVAQWLQFIVPRLAQRGAGLIPGLCGSFWSELARRGD